MKIQSLPKITIITPSFNQGQFIEDTIKSVLDQNYPNLEYIVVDGGSTDNTLEILKKYNTKIKWISEKDNGQSNAINKGLKMATGDIIAYLNSDDLYFPDSFRKIIKFFMSNPSIYWVTGDYNIIDAKGKQIQSLIVWYKRILRLIPTFSMLSITNFIAQPSTFWRKDIINKIGYFDENLDYVMDYDYWLRIIKYYPLKVINFPLSCFRVHKESKGGSKYRNQFQEEMITANKINSNKAILFIHYLHNKLIVFCYSFSRKNN